jgi:hypothetical protein
MKSRTQAVKFVITLQDLESIRTALKMWGKSQDVIDEFNGARLHDHFRMWALFVDTDWKNWDVSEYTHDISCRYWIQLCIEHSTPSTRSALEHAVQPLDEHFKAQMRPCNVKRFTAFGPFTGHPYFWEQNTIHPELEQS